MVILFILMVINNKVFWISIIKNTINTIIEDNNSCVICLLPLLLLILSGCIIFH